jgi:hypothetical protein
MTKTPQTDGATPLMGEWQSVRDIATTAFERGVLFYLADKEKRGEQILDLFDLIASIREYALTRDDLVVVWDKLRQNTLMLDLLLFVTGEISLNSDMGFQQLAKLLANSVHAVIPRSLKDGKWWAGTHNATDSAFLESVSEENQLALILTDNPWALTLLILKRSGIFAVR